VADFYETIDVETDGAVCVITLNRPDVLNACNERMTAELAESLDGIARDDGVRCVVLTGSGRAFCAGQDLADLKSQYDSGDLSVLGERLRKGYNPVCLLMHELEKPIIAAVNGVAAGAGCSLALACDLRIVSESASFIEAFVNVGLVPDVGSTFFLPRLVGFGKAMEICFTGDKVSAAQALSLGIANKVVPADELMLASMEFAKRLAAMPTRAIGLTKRLICAAQTNDLTAQLEAEAAAQEAADKTRDHHEGLTAFLEKRKPTFEGK